MDGERRPYRATVQITGHPDRRRIPRMVEIDRRRPRRTARERFGARPDRIAMWAFGLGAVLVAVATTAPS
jgi:hypothetical protein